MIIPAIIYFGLCRRMINQSLYEIHVRCAHLCCHKPDSKQQ